MHGLRLLLALTLLASACGGGSSSSDAATSSSAVTTIASQAQSTTTTETSTTTLATTTTTITVAEAVLAIDGDETFMAHTGESLALLADLAPEEHATVMSAIDTILFVPAGSGMDVFTKTFRVGEQTAYAPGFDKEDQVAWLAGAIVHDACHSVLYQEGSSYIGRDAELACLQKQLVALEKIEDGGVFQPYLAGLIAGVDDPENSYWTDPNRHW